MVAATDLIAFSVIENDAPFDFSLYLTTADGVTAAKLDVGMWASSPAWSPDGSRIAFNRVAGGNVNWWDNPDDVVLPEDTIHIVNADGSDLVSLGETGGAVAWSPDGNRLAFSKGVEVPGDEWQSEIRVMDVDGSNVKRLGPGSGAAWSPDGGRLAYARKDGIHIMNADGSGDATFGFPGASMPRWSPDGSKLVFDWWWRAAAPHTADVYVMNADGSGLTNLTALHPSHGHIAPAWSPDGQRIAYGATADFGDTWALYVMNADGTGSTALPLPESIRLDRGGGVRATAWARR